MQGDPSPEIYSLLIDPYYSLFLRYFNGSPLNSHDLRRVAIESSSAVFMLSNKFTLTPESEDAKLILQFASIRRFVSLYHNPTSTADPPLYCIQLIQPESKSLVKLHDPDGGTELVICLSELKTSLMSMTAIFPGSCTLLFNLLTAYADDDSSAIMDPSKTLFSLFQESGSDPSERKKTVDQLPPFKSFFRKWKVLNSYQVEDSDDDSQNQDEGLSNTDDLALATNSASNSLQPPRKSSQSLQITPDWFQEYKLGYEWEIYLVQLGTGYRGQKFVNIVASIYEELGVVLFAIRVKDVTGLSHASVMINPYQYTVPMSRNVVIEGFIIAKDKHSANVMSHIANSLSSPIDRSKGKTPQSPPVDTFRRRENICITPGHQEKKNLRDVLYPQSTTSILNSQNSENRGIEYEERLMNEEKVFHQLYYTYSSLSGDDSPATLDQMLISTSLLLEYPLIKNHIVLITKETGIKYLYNFVKPLRKKYLGKCVDIIVLSPVPLSQEIFNSVSIFQGVYWIVGSPLKVHDLRRAGIYRASQCVILADYQINHADLPTISPQQQNLSSEEYSSFSYTLADAESIFIYHSIKKENPSLNILVEIIRSENVKFLESSVSMEYSQRPQTSTNPFFFGDIRDSQYDDENYNYHLSSNFASGSLFMSSIVDALVPQAFYNPHLIVIINKLLGNDDSKASEHHETSLVQILLPEEFDGKTYRDLFTTLLYRGILCIGLYRKKLQLSGDDKYGKKSNPILFSYVYTNPRPEEVVTKSDRIYVLTDKQLLKPHLFSSKVIPLSLSALTMYRISLRLSHQFENNHIFSKNCNLPHHLSVQNFYENLVLK